MAWVVAGTWCLPGPWAGEAGDVARYRIECALGAYSFGNLVSWSFPDRLDREALALSLSQDPDAWSDVSKVTNDVARTGGAGAGGFSRLSGDAWSSRVWGTWIVLLLREEETLIGSFVLSLAPRSLFSALRLGV